MFHQTTLDVALQRTAMAQRRAERRAAQRAARTTRELPGRCCPTAPATVCCA
jgi:hypothetical protein